ncbi:TVP38/TMEM64 family protein [Neobacillus mesonae]|uniref:TVP38/TMEM64 family protein n=1 Tax=Neobacillus mesonae TaxID=1193713 RepID=UPI00203A8B15|nr:VTT domain-containing protein [Neobacillus mesonae]MCM3571261.1 VTT domain-containing protein [Neobacillus mesonae]
MERNLVLYLEGQVLEWFENSGYFVFLLSIILNILISVLGILPSVFITAANISFFGFGYGLFLSILGEALGAIVSFYLYRKGINKLKNKVTMNNKYLDRLHQTKGGEAFLLIIALRILPFIPSGLVTLVSAGSKVGILNFSLASTLGKIPALLIEAYSIQQILSRSFQGKIILTISSIIVFCLLFKKNKR